MTTKITTKMTTKMITKMTTKMTNVMSTIMTTIIRCPTCTTAIGTSSHESMTFITTTMTS